MDGTLKESLNSVPGMSNGPTDRVVFTINNDLRTITIPNGTVLGVYFDRNVHTIDFEMPRYYHDLDLSDFGIRINYVADGEPNIHLAENKVVTADQIKFSWTVDIPAFVENGGRVTFSVCLRKVNSSGEILKEFNTTVNTATVLPGLEVDISPEDSPTVMDYIAQIQQIISEFDDHADEYESTLEDRLSAKTDELIESIPEDYTELTEEVSDLNQALSDVQDCYHTLDVTGNGVQKYPYNFIVGNTYEIKNLGTNIATIRTYDDNSTQVELISNNFTGGSAVLFKPQYPATQFGIYSTAEVHISLKGGAFFELSSEVENVPVIENTVDILSGLIPKQEITGYTIIPNRTIDSNGGIVTNSYPNTKITSNISCHEISKLFISGSFSTNPSSYSIAFYDSDNNVILPCRQFYSETGRTEIVDYAIDVPPNADTFIVGITYSGGQGYSQPLIIKASSDALYTCYVSANGNDSNDGKSAENALKHLQTAINRGFKNIIISAGIYQNEQILLSNLQDIKITCSGSYTEDVFDDSHKRTAKAKIDNSIDIGELTAYDTIYRTSLTVGAESSFYKVFIDHSLDIVYTSGDYYGQAQTYNAILWEVTMYSETTKQLVPVLSVEDCKATAGTFTFDGSYVYVNPYGGTIVGKEYRRLNLDTNQVGFTIENCVDITLDGLDICYFPYINMIVNNSRNVKVKNCNSLCTCYHSGFRFNNSDVDIVNCSSIRAGADGYGINGRGNCSFYNCNASYCGDDGISHHDESTGVIDGGLWTGCLKGGITPSYGSKVNVKNAICKGNLYGIYFLQNNDRNTNAVVVAESCLCIDNSGKDIIIDGYNAIGFNCAYETKQIVSGTFSEYNNAVING